MRVYRTLIFWGGIPMIIDLWTFHREYSLSFTIFSNSLPCNLQESSRQVNAIDAVLCLRGASVRYKSRDISYAVLVMAECRSKPKCLDSLTSKCWGCLLRKSKLDASSMSRSSPIMVRDCASNICPCQWILVGNWATYWIVRRESIRSWWYFDVVCRAENIARLFESVFNFASSEKCCSGSLLTRSQNVLETSIVDQQDLPRSCIRCLREKVEIYDNIQQLCQMFVQVCNKSVSSFTNHHFSHPSDINEKAIMIHTISMLFEHHQSISHPQDEYCLLDFEQHQDVINIPQ